MTSLAETLRQSMEADGPMPLSRFMEACVKDYYGRGEVFGREGDFITAPEITQVFGEIIGLWAAVVWQGMGSPSQVRLVELGPGRGALMKDFLRAASSLPPFRSALNIHLVETSPALEAQQRETLKGTPVTWHETMEDLPDGPMILIANEFFDALPIEQWEKTSHGWRERCVTWDGEALVFCMGEEKDEALLGPAVRQAEPGSIAEVSPQGRALAKTIGERLAAQGGAALIFDYGPLHSGAGDSLQAVKDHDYHPVLETPGEADLTAHVDFEALAEAAKLGGAAAHGPLHQGTFLGGLGIEDRTAKLMREADPERKERLATGCRRLIHAEEMGTLFKVLALTHPGLGLPPGFEVQ